MNKIKLCAIFLLLFSASLFAQNVTVSGVVSEKGNGEPIPYASIAIKGTAIGTSSNEVGEYTLKVASDAVLVVSYIGYETMEIPVNGRAVLNVALEVDAETLEDVVVVAYGTAKKESLTGAVASVGTKAIERRPVTSVSSVLEGASAGVQVNNSYGEPGSSGSIRIRGFGTIAGSNSPLIVLDGVPFGGNISDINPQDIESLSVLKDAASSALFGSRASNGVVMITTKKGKGEKLSMSVVVNQGVYNRGIPEYDRLSADEYMEANFLGYRNSLISNPDQAYSLADATKKAQEDLVTDVLGYNIYNKPSDQLFDDSGKLVAGAQVKPGYTDLDWFAPIERVGYRQDYNVSANGATDKSDYLFSIGYLDEKGYVKFSDFSRLSARANVNVQPKKWIRAGLSTAGSYQISNYTNASSDTGYVNPFYYARYMAPIYPVYLHDMESANGDFLLDASGAKQYDSGEVYSRPQNTGRHVIWENELGVDRTHRSTLAGQAYVDLMFLKDFKFSVKGDVSYRNAENKAYDSPVIGDGEGNNGRFNKTFNRWMNYTFQQQLSWSREFGKHNVDVLLGHENYLYKRDYSSTSKANQVFDGVLQNVNFTEMVYINGFQDNYRIESYLSRAKYNYDNKYFFEASLRSDGSSRFHPDNRWGTFWSVGGSWIVSREKFMANCSDHVNMLKLRASYGQVGDDSGISYYGYLPLYAQDQNGGIGAVYQSQFAAPDTRWEASNSYSVAVEGRFFNRLNVTLEYFDRQTKDLLFDVNNPLSAGALSSGSASSTITKNIGSISNSGIELTADVDVVRKKDFSWNVGFNLTHFKNEIVRLPEENREDGILNGSKKYMEGHSIYDFWIYQFEGVDQMTGDALYLIDEEKYYAARDGFTPAEGTKEIDPEFVAFVNGKYYTKYSTYAKKDWSGSAIPKIFGAVNTNLTWKGLSLSALFTYSVGGKTLDSSYSSLMSLNADPSALHKDVLNSWNGIPAGMTETSANRIDPNGTPALDFYRNKRHTTSYSTRFLQNGSYFIVKNVALSYSFPSKLVRKIDLEGLSINFSADNLFTMTSLKGMNVQQSFSGTTSNSFTTARVFSLGINIRL